MKRRFIVATGPLSSRQAVQVSDIFRDRYGWWHWLDGVWLVVDSTGMLSCEFIRDRLLEVIPGVSNVVLEVDAKFWAGFAPPGAGEHIFDWFGEEWE